jgi:peptide/nickel transport system permease protein
MVLSKSTQQSAAVLSDGTRRPVAFRWVRTHRLLIISGCLILLLVAVAIAGDLIANHDAAHISGRPLKSPSSAHWFGTDNIGRDVFSRVIVGTRSTFIVGLSAGLLGTLIGSFTGAISGFVGGKFDLIYQRLIDIILAFPTLILTLALVAALGDSTRTLIGAIVIAFVPSSNRVVRSAALTALQAQYVEGARSIGAAPPRLFVWHILPQCVPVLTVLASLAVAGAISVQAALGFLGFGPKPPSVSWGQMMSGETLSYVQSAPWMLIAPGAAISLSVYAFNLFGDAFNDFLRPTNRRR